MLNPRFMIYLAAYDRHVVSNINTCHAHLSATSSTRILNSVVELNGIV